MHDQCAGRIVSNSLFGMNIVRYSVAENCSNRSRRLLAFAILAAFTGCDIHSYVPTAEMLRDPTNPSGAFIIEEHDIYGIYANIDVDSAIYAYQTSVADENVFWTAIDGNTADAQWTIVETREDYRRYICIIPKTGEQMFHSVEEVRVTFNPESKRVIVAWVQSDQRELPKDFPTNGPEGNFARTDVWPRFEQEIANRAGR